RRNLRAVQTCVATGTAVAVNGKLAALVAGSRPLTASSARADGWVSGADVPRPDASDRRRYESTRELPCDRQHPVAERQRVDGLLGLEVAPGLGDTERGRDFVGAAASHAEQVTAIAAEASPSLTEIQHDRGRGASQLLLEVGIAGRDARKRLAQRADEVECDIESLEAIVAPHPACAAARRVARLPLAPGARPSPAPAGRSLWRLLRVRGL